MISRTLVLIAALAALSASPAAALTLNLGQEEIVESSGLPITVEAYSVPSLVDWNDDGLPDLLVGEGGGLFQGRVRVFLNEGVAGSPVFGDPFHVLSEGQDLTVPGNG